jgi:hypothetical protein
LRIDGNLTEGVVSTGQRKKDIAKSGDVLGLGRETTLLVPNYERVEVPLIGERRVEKGRYLAKALEAKLGDTAVNGKIFWAQADERVELGLTGGEFGNGLNGAVENQLLEFIPGKGFGIEAIGRDFGPGEGRLRDLRKTQRTCGSEGGENNNEQL